VALRTTCIKNIRFKIIKVRTCCHVDYLYYGVTLNWAARGPRVGHSWFRTTAQVSGTSTSL